MTNIPSPYDDFSDDYDRFVNWPGRLTFELPFLKMVLAGAPHAAGEQPVVLDAACGTGQHALALAELDYPAAGADISAGMVARARANAAARGLDVRFEAVGFGELVAAFGRQSFDAVLCLGNSLPHVLNAAELRAALADFAALLRPGGVLVLQNRNFDQVLAQRDRWMGPESTREGESEWLFVRFYDFLADGLIDFNILRLRREGDGPWRQALTQTRLRPLVRAELADGLPAAGFVDVVWYGGLDGSGFDPTASSNLVAVARRF